MPRARSAILYGGQCGEDIYQSARRPRDHACASKSGSSWWAAATSWTATPAGHGVSGRKYVSADELSTATAEWISGTSAAATPWRPTAGSECRDRSAGEEISSQGAEDVSEAMLHGHVIAHLRYRTLQLALRKWRMDIRCAR